MKNFFILLILLVIGAASFAFSPREVDGKLLQSFNTTFPRAEEVTWYELPTGTYAVHFVVDGVRARSLYEKDGTLVRLIRYYPEQNLPLYVQFKIKSKYPGKNIFGVTEISTISETSGNHTIEYFLKLEDPRFWTTVRMNSSGEVTVIEKLRKS